MSYTLRLNMEAEVKQWGNSFGVILPIDMLRQQGIMKGDRIEIDVVAKKKIDGFGLCRGAEPFEEEEEEEAHAEWW